MLMTDDEKRELIAEARQAYTHTDDDGREWVGRLADALEGTLTEPKAVEWLPSRDEIASHLMPVVKDHHGADENDGWWVRDHCQDYADAVLALIQESYEGGA